MSACKPSAAAANPGDAVSKAHAFEDLKTWQLARDLVRDVYLVTSTPAFSRDAALRDQLRRAAVSSMSNVAEGFERGTKREFIRFLYMARGSAGEVRSHLYVARDLHYIDQSGFDTIQRRVREVSKAVFNFIKYLESSKTGEAAPGT
jgi:four helix bundle protein